MMDMIGIAQGELHETAKVLVALAESIEEMLITYARAIGGDVKEAREAAEGGRRALMVSAAVCEFVHGQIGQSEAEKDETIWKS